MFRAFICFITIMLAACSHQQEPSEVRVAFSPSEEARQLVLQTINAARKEVLVSSYFFTDVKIMQALISKKKEGVDVKVISDVHTPDIKSLRMLTCFNIPVTLISNFRIHHNKYIVADEFVQTGSYNYTHSAAYNSENVMVVRNANIARQYRNHWHSLHGQQLTCPY